MTNPLVTRLSLGPRLSPPDCQLSRQSGYLSK